METLQQKAKITGNESINKSTGFKYSVLNSELKTLFTFDDGTYIAAVNVSFRF